MTHPKSSTGQKYISVPVLLSTFIGVLAALPMALTMNSAINVGAAPVDKAAVQSDAEAFARYAHAFNQGYDASLSSSSSMAGSQPSSCSESTASVGGGSEAMPSGTTAHAATPMRSVSGHGRTSAAAASHDVSDRTAHMVNSYNSYVSTVNNSSTATSTNVNSNNTVGSHNMTRTDVSVEDSLGVVVGVENESTATQNNTSESFNEDSFNTSTETTTVSDSFNTDVTNTTDIDTTVTTTENSNNTQTNTLNNNSNNTTTTEVDTHVDVNSHNDSTLTAPVVTATTPPALPATDAV